MDILIEKGYCFNPDSDYIDPFDVQRVLNPDSGVSSTHRDGVVYGIWCPVDDTYKLGKGGWSNNATDRNNHYNMDDNTCNEHKMLGHIFYDTIPFEIDQKLRAELLGFVHDVINDHETPEPMRQYYISLLSPKEHEDGREWHRGGPGRQMMTLMVEYGFNQRYNTAAHRLSNPGEGFMFNMDKHDYMVETAQQAASEMKASVIAESL